MSDIPKKRTLRLKYSCKFPGCMSKYYVDTSSTHRHRNKHFFRFPRECKKEQLGEWKQVCRISDEVSCNSYYVCEDHFLQKDFVNFRRERLNYGVVPKNLQLAVYYHDQCEPRIEESGDLSDMKDLVDIRRERFNYGVVPENRHLTVDHHVQCETDVEESGDVSDMEGQVRESDSPLNVDAGQYEFLSTPIAVTQGNVGVLGSGVRKSDLTPTKSRMYRIHRNNISKLAKLRGMLRNEKKQLKCLKKLYDEHKFQFMEDSLNEVTKNFINSQLRNASKAPSVRRWSVEDKVFALSIYKRGPRLYRYLASHFQLPSVRLLKSLLSNIPFDAGFNSAVIEVLKAEVSKMNDNDKYCALLFDEMSLEKGLYYEASKQYIFGYEDLGHLGRSPKQANHALVFMIRGLRKTWKQIIAYYFTSNSIASLSLKQLIVFLITELQKLGLKVVCTVCDQGSTNQKALKELCQENHDNPSQFHFVVKGEPVAVIFDVPHLLKNTRNALIGHKIEVEAHKEVKFEYIERVFNLDQERRFKTLPKLKEQHFNFKDSFMKMKVKVAALQLSHTVAAAIETYVATNVLPSEAIYTAEFVEKIDNLFDSLNSCNQYPHECKMFRCALSDNSLPVEMWYSILKEMGKWKLKDLMTGKDKTDMFSFLNGWQITLRSVIFIWNRLKKVGFKFLNLKTLNQDPLENAFCCVRQHGIANTNPTCFQFTAALKTCIINNMALPFKSMSNCAEDDCFPLSNLCHLLHSAGDEVSCSGSPNCDGEDIVDFLGQVSNESFSQVSNEGWSTAGDCQAVAYVAGYILKKMDWKGDCEICRASLFSATLTERHLFTSFKEHDGTNRLMYASDQLQDYLLHLHDQLYLFLEKHGHLRRIEDTFRVSFTRPDVAFCAKHSLEDDILTKAVKFLIYKYVRDNKVSCKRKWTSGHPKKIKYLMLCKFMDKLVSHRPTGESLYQIGIPYEKRETLPR